MEIPVCEAEKVIKRASAIMKEYKHDPLMALIIAENELEEKKKKENKGE